MSHIYTRDSIACFGTAGYDKMKAFTIFVRSKVRKEADEKLSCDKFYGTPIFLGFNASDVLKMPPTLLLSSFIHVLEKGCNVSIRGSIEVLLNQTETREIVTCARNAKQEFLLNTCRRGVWLLSGRYV
jgi:hypothetical protein